MIETDYSNYYWQGERVRLRGLCVEDAERRFIDSLDSPARQVLQLGVELPTTVEAGRQMLEERGGCKDVNGVILFAIENLDGENVGGLSYHTRDRKNGTFSFGIIISRDHRRRGYAVDAVRILLRYAFWERRYQKCNSICIATNEGSIAMHRSLGFVEEGRIRRNLFFNGQYYDDLCFGLTREEFDAMEGDRRNTVNDLAGEHELRCYCP